ncbi:MAG: hypothetical protein SVU32_00960 [Candidatus Nanohaloarchaea archaeon]|nr:hypothetical protein [Candidatus Nanohaloarchaea archaeon]
MTDLDENEQRLVETAKERIRKHARERRKQGLNDILYAFVRSTSGSIYAGKPFESNQPSFNFCAERHAINTMQYEETEEARLDAILVAGPVPEGREQPVTPCGACRHAIHEFGGGETPVIAASFVRQDRGWELFTALERYTASELYPAAYEPVNWD